MARQTAGQKEVLIQRIITEALRRGYSVPEIFSLLAIANIESGFNPKVIGDGGKSFGLFQVNEARFPRYGVTPQTARQLLDVNYQLPRVFDDFEQLRQRLRKTTPDIFQDLPTEISPAELEERLAKAFVLYGTYWNRPALLDEVLRDPRAFAKVYPKVRRDVMRQKMKETYQYLMRFLPHAARGLQAQIAGQMAKALGLTLQEKTEVPARPLPYTQVRPATPVPTETRTPVIAELAQLAPHLPTLYALGKTFLNIVRPYEERKEKPPIQYAFKTLPNYKYADEDEKIIGHLLQQFVPGFETVWKRMRPDERVSTISLLKSTLRTVAPLHNRLAAEQDPQRRRELQAQIDRQMRAMLVRLHQAVLTLRAMRPPSWRLAGEIMKEFGVGAVRDVLATLLVIPASVDFRRQYPIRDPQTGTVTYVSFPEFVRHRIQEKVRSLPLDKREAVIFEKLAMDVLPTKPTAPLWLIYDTLKGALVDLVGGIAWAGASLGDWVMGVLGRRTRAGKAVEQLFNRWGRLVGYYATELARDPEFRRRHAGYAFNFLLTVNPDAINRRTMQPTEYGWYQYTQHFVVNRLQDIAAHALGDQIPQWLHESLLHRSPILGFLTALLVPGGVLKLADKAIKGLAQAGRLSERAAQAWHWAVRGAAFTLFGMPEEALRPIVVSRLGSKIAETALRGVTAERATIWEQAARLVGRPSKPLVTLLKSGVKEGLPWEEVTKVYQRSFQTVETMFDALTGTTMGLIYMSPPFGDERDYVAGMLAGLGMSMGLKLPSLLVGKAWNRIAEKAGLPISEYKVPSEVGLRVWERMREFIRDVMGIESVVAPTMKRPQAEAELKRFGQAVRKLFGDELAVTILNELWEEYLGRRYPPITPEVAERLRQLRPTLIQEATQWVYQNLPDEFRTKIEAGQPLQPTELRDLQNHVFNLTVQYFTQEKKFNRPPSEKLAAEVWVQLLLDKNIQPVPRFPKVPPKDIRAAAFQSLVKEIPAVARAVGRPNLHDLNDLTAWTLIRLPSELVDKLQEPVPVLDAETATALRRAIVTLTEPYFRRLSEQQQTALRSQIYRRLLEWHNKLPPETPTGIVPYRPPAITAPFPTAIVPFRRRRGFEEPVEITPYTPPPAGRPVNLTLDDVERLSQVILTHIAHDPKAAQDVRGIVRAARKIYGEASEGVAKVLEATTLMQAAKTAARKAEFLLYHLQKYGLLPDDRAKERRTQVLQLYREYDRRFRQDPHVVRVRENAIEFLNRLVDVMNEVVREARLDDEVRRAIQGMQQEPSVTVRTVVPQEPIPGERVVTPTFPDPRSQTLLMVLSGTRTVQRAIEPEMDWVTRQAIPHIKVIHSFSREKSLGYIEALKGSQQHAFVYRATDPEAQRENWVIIGVPAQNMTEEGARQIADALMTLLGATGHTEQRPSFNDLVQTFEPLHPLLSLLSAWWTDREKYRRMVMEDAETRQWLMREMNLERILRTPDDWELFWMRTTKELHDNQMAWDRLAALASEDDQVRLRRTQAFAQSLFRDIDLPIGLAYWIVSDIDIFRMTEFVPELNYKFVTLNRRLATIQSLLTQGRIEEFNAHLGTWFSAPGYNWTVQIRSDLPTPLAFTLSEHSNSLSMTPAVYEDFMRFYLERYRHDIEASVLYPSHPLAYFLEFLKTRPDLQQHISTEIFQKLTEQLQRQFTGRGFRMELEIVTQTPASLLPSEIQQNMVRYVEENYPHRPELQAFLRSILNSSVAVVRSDELWGAGNTWGLFKVDTPHVVYVYDVQPVERSVILHEQMHQFLQRLSGETDFYRRDHLFRQFTTNPDEFYDLIPILLDPKRILYFLAGPADGLFRLITTVPHPYIRGTGNFRLLPFLQYAVLSSLNIARKVLHTTRSASQKGERFRQQGMEALESWEKDALRFANYWAEALIKNQGSRNVQFVPTQIFVPLAVRLLRFHDAVMEMARLLSDIGLQDAAAQLRRLYAELPLRLSHQIVLGVRIHSDAPFSISSLLGRLGDEYLVWGYRQEMEGIAQILQFVEGLREQLERHGLGNYVQEIQETAQLAMWRLNEFPNKFINWLIDHTVEAIRAPENVVELAKQVGQHPDRLSNPEFVRQLKQWAPEELLRPPTILNTEAFPLNNLIEEMLTTTMHFIGKMADDPNHRGYHRSVAGALVSNVIPILLDMAKDLNTLLINNPELYLPFRLREEAGQYLARLQRTYEVLDAGLTVVARVLGDDELQQFVWQVAGRLADHYRSLLAVHPPSVAEVVEFVRKNFPTRPLMAELPISRRQPAAPTEPPRAQLAPLPSPSVPEEIKDIRDILRVFLSPSRQPAYNTVVQHILEDPLMTLLSFRSGYELYRSLAHTLRSSSEKFWNTFHEVLFPEILSLSETIRGLLLQFHPQLQQWGRRGSLSMDELRLLDNTFRQIQEELAADIAARISTRLSAQGLPLDYAMGRALDIAQALVEDMWVLSAGVLPRDITAIITTIQEELRRSPLMQVTSTGKITYLDLYKVWRRDISRLFDRFVDMVIVPGTKNIPWTKRLYRELFNALQYASEKAPPLRKWLNNLANRLNNEEQFEAVLKAFPKEVLWQEVEPGLPFVAYVAGKIAELWYPRSHIAVGQELNDIPLVSLVALSSRLYSSLQPSQPQRPGQTQPSFSPRDPFREWATLRRKESLSASEQSRWKKLKEEIPKQLPQIAPWVERMYRSLLRRFRGALLSHLDLYVLGRYLSNQHRRLSSYLEKTQQFAKLKFAKPLLQTHYELLHTLLYDNLKDLPKETQSAIVRFAEEITQNELHQLIHGQLLSKGIPTEYRPALIQQIMQAWLRDGIDGVVEKEFVHPQYGQRPVTFSRSQLENMVSNIVNAINQYWQDVERVQRLARQILEQDPKVSKLKEWLRWSVQKDPNTGMQQLIDHLGNPVTDTLLFNGYIQLFQDNFMDLIQTYHDELTQHLVRRYGNAGGGYARTFLEVVNDAKKLMNFISNHPEVFVDTLRFLSQIYLEQEGIRAVSSSQFKYLGFEEAERMIRSLVRSGMRGGIETRFLATLALIGALATAYKAFPGLAAVLSNAYALLASAPITSVWTMAGLTGLAGITLIGMLKGRPILRATAANFSTLLERASHLFATTQQTITQGVEAAAQRLAEVDPKLGAIAKAAAAELIEAPGVTPVDGMVDELVNSMKSGSNAIFAQKPLREVTGRSVKLTRREREQIAQTTAQRVGILALLMGNQQLMDTVENYGKLTLEAQLMLNGLQNIAKNRSLGNDLTRNYLAYVFFQFMKGKPNWQAIADQPLRDVWKRTLLSVPVPTPQGIQREHFKVTDFTIDIGGQQRNVGDLTVRELWDELYRHYGYTGWSLNAISALDPATRYEILRNATSYLRHRMKEFIKMQADPQLRASAAYAAMALDGIRRVKWVLSDPETAASVEYHPVSRLFFVENLMEADALMQHPRVQQALGAWAQPLRDFYRNYLDAIRQHDPALYQSAQRLYQEGQKHLNAFITRVENARVEDIPKILEEWSLENMKLLRKWLLTAARRLEVAGVDRPLAEQIRHMMAEPGAHVNSAWVRLMETPWEEELLLQITTPTPEGSAHVAPFIVNHPAAAIFREIAAGARPPKERATPMKLWSFVGAQGEALARRIAQSQKVSIDEVRKALNKVMYYAYTAVRDPNTFPDFNAVFQRIDEPMRRILTSPAYRNYVESLTVNAVISAAYLTNLLSTRALLGETLFRGEPRVNLIERAYFPLSPELADMPQDIWSSLIVDLADLMTGENDRLRVTRYGIGKRMFHYERTERALPKAEQFYNIMTNFFRTINAYNALLPYAPVLKGLTVLAPKWLQPAITRELHLTVGSPLLRRGYRDPIEAFVDTLARRAEGWELIANYLSQSAPMVSLEMMTRLGGAAARLLSVTQIQALAANINSIVRQITTFPYAAARLVSDFGAPLYALLPLWHFPRALWIALRSQLNWELSPVERMLLARIPALLARHEQSHRAAILRGVEFLTMAAQERGPLAHTIADLLDPTLPTDRKAAAFAQLDRQLAQHGTLSEKLTELLLGPLQLLDEAMVIATALAGMEAYLAEAQSKRLPITDEVLREAIAYGANLAESVQATPNISFAPVAFNDPRMAVLLGPIARQFVVVGFATAETNSKLLLKDPLKAVSDLVTVFRGQKPASAALDAFEQLSKTLVALAVLNLGLLSLNALYQSLTGRQLEEVPLGYPPDDQSLSLANLIEEGLVAMTPRAVVRLGNLLAYAFMGNAPAVYDTTMTTDVPPVIRGVAQTYNAVTKGTELYRAFSLLGELPKYKEAPFMEKLWKSIEYMRRSGTDTAKVSTLADILWALMAMASLNPTTARAVQWFPLGQLARTGRAVMEMRQGLPAPAVAELGEKWYATTAQAIAGLPWAYGHYPPFLLFHKLAGPVTEIQRKRASAAVKTHDFIRAFRPIPAQGVFVGLTEYARRANTPADLNALLYLTAMPQWVRHKDSLFGQSIHEFLQAANTSEDAMYQFIMSKPNDFIAMMLLFGPEEIQKRAPKVTEHWFHNGQFMPQAVIAGLRRYGYISPDKEPFAEYLLDILRYATQTNLRQYVVRKYRDLLRRQMMQRALSEREAAKQVKEAIE
jgi:hypothetical protein